MKKKLNIKIINTILFLLSSFFTVLSQEPAPADKVGIGGEPSNPCAYNPNCFLSPCESVSRPPIRTNPQDIYHLNNSPEGYFSKPNLFNWLLEDFRVNSVQSSDPRYVKIKSPFYGGKNDNQPNLSSIKASLGAEQLPDNDPLNGWELIYEQLGYNYQGLPITNPVDVFYIVLYNKFTSTLRVFAASDKDHDANGAYLYVGFVRPSSQTAMFDLVNPLKPLSYQPDLTAKIFSAEGLEYQSSADKRYWYYADFPIMYDPCTCSAFGAGFNSLNITVQLKFKVASTITLTGSLVGNAATNTEMMNAFHSTEVKNGTKAVQALKGIEGFLNSNKGALNEPIKALENRLGILNTQSGTNQAARISEMNFIMAHKDQPADAYLQLLQQNEDIKANVRTTSIALKTLNFLKQGFQAAPFLSIAIKALDFFSAGGQAPNANKPQTGLNINPLKIDASIKLQGSITGSIDKDPISIIVPGLQKYSLGSDAPYYNEVLGVFNLVDAPEFDRSRKSRILKRFNTMTLKYEEGSIDEWNYRLIKPLTYVLNPASGLEIQEAEYELIAYSQRPIDYLYGAGAYPGSFHLSDGFDQKKQAFIYATPWKPISSIGRDYHSATVSYLIYTGNTYTYDWHPTHMRIRLNLRRKDGLGQNVLLVYTFPIASIRNTTNDLTTYSYFLDNGFKQLTNEQIGTVGNSGICNGTYRSRMFKQQNNEIVNEVEQGLKVDVSPNPVQNSINLKVDLNKESKISVFLTDISGRLVHNMQDSYIGSAGINQINLHVNNISNGIYFLIVDIEGKKEVKKIVIAK